MIYKRHGKWAVRIDLGYDERGRRKRLSIGTYATKKEAESAERAALKSREDGIDFDAAQATLRDVCDRFIERCRAKGLSPATCVRYAELYRDAAVIANVRIGDLKRDHVASVYRAARKRGLSPKTLRVLHTALRAAVAWAAPESAALRAFTLAARDLPNVPKTLARAIEASEMHRLLEAAADTPWHAFLLLAVCTGARRSELAALRWRDVDVTRKSVRIAVSLTNGEDGTLFDKPTKTAIERDVPLNAIAIDALRAHRVRQAQERLAAGSDYDNDDRIFADAIGRPWNPRSISNAFRRIAADAGVRARLHDLRHSAVTWMLQSGSDVRTVAGVVGHASAATTLQRYAHVMPGAQEQAVERIAERLAVALGGGR